MSWKKGNRLRTISEPDAGGRTREIFEEIKSKLGLPYVGLVFQAYAAYPAFLEAQWAHLRPVVERQEFFSLAGRLRADAYTRMHNYFEIPDLEAQASALGHSGSGELCEVVDLFHYSNTLELLIVAAQWQALDGPVGKSSNPRDPAPDVLVTPTTQSVERPRNAKCPILVDEQSASPAAITIFDEVKRTLAVPLTDVAFRAVARWPEFLCEYWGALQQILQLPMYQECLHGIYESAWNLAHELPAPLELTPDQMADLGLSDQEIVSIVRISELFLRMTTGMALNLAVAKIALEGGSCSQGSVRPKSLGEPKQAA